MNRNDLTAKILFGRRALRPASTGRQSRTSHSVIFAVLGVAVLLVCFNAWLALHSVQALADSEGLVAHTWQVMNSLERVIGTLKDAESGNRGYLLTGDEAYLAPYTQATADLPKELATVAQLVQDNPDQVEALHQLKALIESRMSLLEQGIEARNAGDMSSTHILVLSGTGMAEMNHARTLVGQMQQTERHLLEHRTAASHYHAVRARLTLILASAVDVLLIVAMFRYILNERKLRQDANRTLDRLQKLQSISDVALTQLTLPRLTTELLFRVQRVISADAALLCTAQDDSFRVESATGLEIAPGTLIPRVAGDPLERAASLGQVVIVPDTDSAPLSMTALRRHTRSLMVTPLTISGAVAGLLLAGRTTTRAFGEDDEEMLSVVADRIAIALDRANAYESERKARKDAEARAEEIRQLNAELEERVQQRTADLEASNRELEAFSYSVSHDLRAPLRTVDGFSLALEEDYRTVIDANGLDFLRRIREGVQRMGQLIDSLLQLSRITRADLTREPVDLSALAASIAEEQKAHNPDRKLNFTIEPGLHCQGDPRLLRAAIENLLGNAVKFTAREPEAIIEVGQSGEAYFIRDNGAGFDMQYSGKLFNAFNRLHGDRDFKGSGIGLATVARIVRRHQGKIWAEGDVGHGATFWFTLG